MPKCPPHRCLNFNQTRYVLYYSSWINWFYKALFCAQPGSISNLPKCWWRDMMPRDNMPRVNMPRENMPRDNMPPRQYATWDNMPRDNMPPDNMPPGDNLPPGDNMPPGPTCPKTICHPDNLSTMQTCHKGQNAINTNYATRENMQQWTIWYQYKICH